MKYTLAINTLLVLLLVIIYGCGGESSDDEISDVQTSNDGIDVGNGSGTNNGLNLSSLITASYMVDVDKDGDLDIILGKQGDPVRTSDILLINDGNANFTIKENAFPAHHLGTGGATINIAHADFNNDGNVDIIASTNDARNETFDDTIQIQLYLGNGDGTFYDATANISNGLLTDYPEWIRVADFDNDGFSDFMITSNGCGVVSDCHGGRIYLNDGSASFEIASATMTDAERSYTDTKIIWENDGNSFPHEGSLRVALDVFLDDINKDGKMDLIAPNGYAEGPPIVSFLNHSTAGNLQFTIVYNVPNPMDPFDSTRTKNGIMIDINNDGNKDIVSSFSISGQDNLTTPIFAFISQGDGKFIENNSIFGATQPGVEHARQWIVDDFDQNGSSDLLVADHGLDAVPFPGEKNLLLLNDGAGKLEDTTATNLSSLSGFTHGASSGDLNGDGYPDLFLNNGQLEPSGSFTAEKEARLWINNGNGSFTSKEL